MADVLVERWELLEQADVPAGGQTPDKDLRDQVLRVEKYLICHLVSWRLMAVSKKVLVSAKSMVACVYVGKREQQEQEDVSEMHIL